MLKSALSRCQFSDFLSSLNQDLADGGIRVDVGRVLLSASSTSRRVGGEGDREVEELVSYSFQIPGLLLCQNWRCRVVNSRNSYTILNRDLADGGIRVDVGRVLLSTSSTSKRVGREGEREVEELVSYSFKIPTI